MGVGAFKSFSPGLPVVSIHVPKAAGTSFKIVLQEWYKDQLFLYYPDVHIKDISSINELSAGQCVHGHFSRIDGHGIEKFANDKPENSANIITMIRDPFDMIVSLFLYLKYKAPEEVFKSRPQQFKPVFDYYVKNKHYLFPSLLSDESREQDLDEYIKRYVFIGLQENYDKSISVLSSLLNFPYEKSVRENISDYSRDDIPDMRSEAKEIFKAEYRFYDKVKSIIDSY